MPAPGKMRNPNPITPLTMRRMVPRVNTRARKLATANISHLRAKVVNDAKPPAS
ncbi:MAG: hypothetical protein M3309_05450 [Actinomycetota bacterium]|nr:hypothetical protein [Actinomycetota bacterium]